MKKTCGKCQLPKLVDEFFKSAKSKDGRQGYCKECMADYKRTPAQQLNGRLQMQKRRATDPDRVKRLKRESHARNKLANNAYTRAWRKANPEKFKAGVKRWYDAHPEAKAKNRNRRRVRHAQAAGSHTREEWAQKCAEYGHCCGYCGKKTKLTRHHIVPLSKGGDDWISNLVPACGSCNSKIGTRTVPPTQPGTVSCTATKAV